MDYDIDLP